MNAEKISQTLFRFVSLRAPELAEEQKKPYHFVRREDYLINTSQEYFDDIISNKPNEETHWSALFNSASSFPNPLKDEKEVQILDSKLYEFGVWIFRNRTTINQTQLLAQIQLLNTQLSNSELITLWNNLVYQVVTQKSFMVKEAIIHILVANHVFKHHKNGAVVSDFHFNKELIYATIVLPSVLFGVQSLVSQSTNNKNGKSISVEGSFSDFGKKMAEVTAHSIAEKELDILRKELQLLEKKYINEPVVHYELIKKVVHVIENQ